MGIIEPDLSDVVEIKEGQYKARIVDSTIKESRAGNTFVNWQLEVFGAEPAALNGFKLPYMTMVAGRGAGRLKRFFKAATGEVLEGSFDTEQLHGREVTIGVHYPIKEGVKSEWPEVKSVVAIKD